MTPPTTASRRSVRILAAIASAGLVTATFLVSGALVATHDTLVIMGFDPDRSQLLVALLAAAQAAAVAVLVADRRTVATPVGAAAAIAVFVGTFLDETGAALASSGDQGRFDAVGWSLTVVALLSAAVVVSWSAAVVAGEVRAAVGRSVGVVRSMIEGRSFRGQPVWRPIATVAIAVVLAVSLPTFADLVNYSPDADMRQAGPPIVGLFGGAPADTSGDVPSGSPGDVAGGSPSGDPTSVGDSPDAAGLLPPESSGPGAMSTARPWLSSIPTGSGHVVSNIHLPAPWTGGSANFATLSVYLPPGYDASAQRYPVIYEVPWSFDYWDRSVHFPAMLDRLIDEGRIPPVIVAFVAHNGAPIPDTECVDSKDGRQQLETYMSSTVVSYLDQAYRTIPTSSARALFGFSGGGYCAPMLMLRHPDVFSSAISMSGYYQAGVRSSQTLNAWRPFGGDPQMIAAYSPIGLLKSLPSVTRRQMLFVVSGDSTEPFYGPQYTMFTEALRQQSDLYRFIPTRLGHAWRAVRAALPAALEAVASRWVAAGVLTPP